MSNSLYLDLSWLPRAPADFSARCKQIGTLDQGTGHALRLLASSALTENQLNRLAGLISSLISKGHDLKPLIPFKLGILSNATTDFLVPPLIATAARHGFALTCVETPFGQMLQSSLDPKSALYRHKLDAVLLAIDFRGLPLNAVLGDSEIAETACANALAQIDAIREAVHTNAKVPCILQTLARPVEMIFGNLDLGLPGTERQLIDAFNRGLAQSTAGTQDILLDLAGLAETAGLAAWHDPGLWNLGKIPFANEMLPLYSDVVCRLIAALRGKSRRCLVLDLDNTLWGGIIGDDGLEGIALAQGDAVGEAYLSVQRTALTLRGRGIVLAVSSKNQDSTARLPFQQHAEMLLKESHIAVFQANWNDKATNIKAIAQELSLGLESMVFLDDNPAERGLVREMLPEVAIPELPDDPALYARTLLASGYFEAIAFSAEDRQRAEFYQDNARRLTLQHQAGDINSYLRSLEMVITFAPFDAVGRTRIAQLISKSNQFNLTTRRYSELEVGALESDAEFWTLQVRLRDTFGDNGMICAVICKRIANTWEIDTWLMSCRVLGRGVEQSVLNEIASHAREENVAALIGRYLPTARNEMVKDHFQKLGFEQTQTEPDGGTTWRLDLDGFSAVELPIKVESFGRVVGVA